MSGLSTTIFLHPISAKIIAHEYHLPICVDSRDTLIDHLSVTTHRRSDRSTVPVEITLTRGTFPPISDGIGEYIWRLHKRQVYAYMFGQLRAGRPALAALADFYDLYDIDDDDFDMDNLYREWTRHYSRYKARFQDIDITRMGKATPAVIPTDIQETCVRFVSDHVDVFWLPRADKFNTVLYRSFILYIDHKIIGLSPTKIMRKHKTTRMNLYKMSNRWADTIRYTRVSDTWSSYFDHPNK